MVTGYCVVILGLISWVAIIWCLLYVVKKKYFVIDYSRCTSCSFRSVCSRLKLNKIFPPTRRAKPIPWGMRLLIALIPVVGYFVIIYLVSIVNNEPINLYSMVLGATVATAFSLVIAGEL
ncbi:hypothetical protein J4526_07075 [Desulfurococcaceae archaeon MEX13E-LK6-19]|nr:hypothetical protein J4526_07075 [Desulfurococcaceae archaeon MEX13E-LK6-19]